MVEVYCTHIHLSFGHVIFWLNVLTHYIDRLEFTILLWIFAATVSNGPEPQFSDKTWVKSWAKRATFTLLGNAKQIYFILAVLRKPHEFAT